MTDQADVKRKSSRSAVRFEALDGWRGVGAVLIALGHLEVVEGHRGLLGAGPFIANIYLFVDFFFVISGFVISHSAKGRILSLRDGRDFVLRRFARLWPLHAAVLAAFVCVELTKLLHGDGDARGFSGTNTLPSLISNLLLLNAFGLQDRLTWNIQSWTIGAEFWTYIVFALLVLATPRSAPMLFVAMIGLVVVSLSGHRDMNQTYDFGFFRCLYGFFVGCLTYVLLDRQAGRPVGRIAGTLAECAVVGVMICYVTGSSGTITLLSPLVFAVVVAVFAKEQGSLSMLLKTSVPQRLGLLSYSIYMIHTFFVFKIYLVCRAVAARFNQPVYGSLADYMRHDLIQGRPMLGGAILLVSYFAVVIAASAVTERLIERPGRKLFQSGAGPRRPHTMADAGLPARER